MKNKGEEGFSWNPNAAEFVPLSMRDNTSTRSCSISSSLMNVTATRNDNLLEKSIDTAVDYMKQKFPDTCKDSLREVYMVNHCDLHDAIEFLTQLELYAAVECGGGDVASESGTGLRGENSCVEKKNEEKAEQEEEVATSSSNPKPSLTNPNE